jgi:DNA polymerase-3 subunit beta
MKLTINQKNLKKALALTERITTRNLTLPILNNIVLKTENGRLKIIATNLEIGMSVFIGAKIDEAGEVAIPGRVFADFISGIFDEQVSISTKSNVVSIQSKTYKTHILGIDTKEYPLIPKIKSDPICSLPCATLREVLLRVSDAMAVSDARAELAGVYMHFSPHGITCAATDVFRLAEQVLPIKAQGEHVVIIPRNTVLEIMRICGELEGDIGIRIGDNQISFSTDDMECISRLIDGKYPDYKRVIPEKCLSQALVEREELEQNTRIAGLFSSNIADITIRGEDKKIILTAKNSDKGELQATIPAILKDEAFEVSLNFHYLIDGLRSMRTDKVLLEFTGTGSPFVLRPDDKSKSGVYLIMPLRV